MGMMILLRRLWTHISPRRKKQFSLLCLLMMLASIAEVISIGAILPFLGALTAPSTIFEINFLKPFFRLFDIESAQGIVLPFAVLFGCSVLLACFTRLLLVWANTRFSFLMGADIGNDIYRRSLYQPYIVQLSRNSSEVINGVIRKSEAVTNFIVSPLLTLISSIAILCAVFCLLIFINPLISLMVFGVVGLIYAAMVFKAKKYLIRNSKLISTESNLVLKSLNEGFGGIRDVLVDRTQEIYCREYRDADYVLRKAQSSTIFISTIPRFLMEALGMLLIAIGATFSVVVLDVDASIIIATFGVLGLAAQRMLPLMQQCYSSWSIIQSNNQSLADILDLLDQPLPTYSEEKISFNDELTIADVSFRYGGDLPLILKNVNLTIKKGSKVGLIGATGSGKSTLIDILIGLLEPTSGKLLVDGVSIKHGNARGWQMNVAHVPQSIFLSDAPISENIAFGMPSNDIDMSRVRRAAELAELGDFIEKLPKKYQTIVGEKGARLSGGQRQRIGIARALYKNASVIILDEATSALDVETEKKVMNSIEALPKEITLIIIAHRISTLKACTQIIQLDGEGKCKLVSFSDLAI
jgi:ABC-type multidrug transport system fused ATPase/permease subunit